jgi:hypothetical protein
MCVSLTLFTFAGKDTRTIASLLRIAVLSWHPHFSYFYGSVFLTTYVKFPVSNFSGLVYCFLIGFPPQRFSNFWYFGGATGGWTPSATLMSLNPNVERFVFVS